MLLSIDERQALAEMVDSLLEKEWSTIAVRDAEGVPGGWASGIWSSLAEVDVLTLGLAAEHGGSGAGMAELRLMAEAVGRHLVPIPFTWSSVLATTLVSRATPSSTRDLLLDALRNREVVTVAVLRGDELVAGPGPSERVGAPRTFQVPYGSTARYALVVEAPTSELTVIDLQSTRPVAQTRSDLQSIGTLERDEISAVSDGGGRLELTREAFTDGIARWKVATAAVALGGEERLTELCSAYAAEREQFGRPIGAFQAVAHPIVDMHVRGTSDRVLVDIASWRIDGGEVDSGWVAASRAKAAATGGYARAGVTAIQVHGGHGFSEENDVQLHFRRSRGLEVTWGSPRQEYEAVATATSRPSTSMPADTRTDERSDG